MHVLMASIPHSGTGKTIRIFEKAGFAQMGVDEPSNVHPDEHRLRWCHLQWPDRRDKVYELAAMGYPLVCPMRHPWRNLASLKKRSWDEMHINGMLDAWNDCLERIFPRAMLLPVDADELTRARYKKAIELELGMTLDVDWSRLSGAKHPTTAYLRLDECVPKDDAWQRLDLHHVIREIYP